MLLVHESLLAVMLWGTKYPLRRLVTHRHRLSKRTISIFGINLRLGDKHTYEPFHNLFVARFDTANDEPGHGHHDRSPPPMCPRCKANLRSAPPRSLNCISVCGSPLTLQFGRSDCGGSRRSNGSSTLARSTMMWRSARGGGRRAGHLGAGRLRQVRIA